MTIEETLEKARELVQKFDKKRILINSLTIFDTGFHSGYIATFEFTESLQSVDEYEKFFEYADEFPRTARGLTVAEAIQKAIAKCEAE